METHNIVSTPAITGNIGSCTSQVTGMTTSGNFWESQTKDYLTNSCTGQVIEGAEHWQPGFGWFTVPILAFFAVWMAVWMVGLFITDSW